MKSNKKNSPVRRPLRQGDVVLLPITDMPEGKFTKRLRKTGVGLVLAEGEQTGHHHAIASDDCDLLATEGEAGVTVLEVRAAMAALVHDEHGTIAVPKGYWRVVIKRQYTPKAIVRVTD